MGARLRVFGAAAPISLCVPIPDPARTACSGSGVLPAEVSNSAKSKARPDSPKFRLGSVFNSVRLSRLRLRLRLWLRRVVAGLIRLTVGLGPKLRLWLRGTTNGRGLRLSSGSAPGSTSY